MKFCDLPEVAKKLGQDHPIAADDLYDASRIEDDVINLNWSKPSIKPWFTADAWMKLTHIGK